MVGPFVSSGSGLEAVIQRRVDEDLNRRDEVDVVGGRPVAAGTQVCVGGVVRSGGPLGAHDVISTVVVHRQHVLLGQHVAVSFNAKILLHTLKDGAGLHEVATELLAVARRGRVVDVAQGVNNDSATSKLTNFTSADANTTATPGHCARSSQCRSGEGQHSHLIQVVSDGGVDDQSVQLFTTLTQLGAGFCNRGSGQVVGLQR